MKVAYILFSGPMIRALRARSKTQTRRTAAPRWAAGDLLVVRENFQLLAPLDNQKPSIMMRQTPIHYMADGEAPAGYGKGRPSIHLPRIASRLTLRVQEVREEPLLEISEEDALAEGIFSWPYLDCDGDPRLDGQSFEARGFDWKPETDPLGGHDSAAAAYFDLWDHINGEGASAANPQVFATTFEIIEKNVEEVLK